MAEFASPAAPQDLARSTFLPEHIKKFALSSLTIVAYSANPPESLRPYIVAPIFRTQSDTYIVAPYEFDGENLLTDNEIDLKRLEELDGWLEGEIVKTDQPLQAHPNHCLWVNLDGQVLYEPTEIMKGKFTELMNESLAKADEFLRLADTDQAFVHVRRALNTSLTIVGSKESQARSAYLKAAVLFTLCHERKGEVRLANFSRDLAIEDQTRQVTADEFDSLLAQLRTKYNDSSPQGS